MRHSDIGVSSHDREVSWTSCPDLLGYLKKCTQLFKKDKFSLISIKKEKIEN